jgi:hypothetical protein
MAGIAPGHFHLLNPRLNAAVRHRAAAVGAMPFRR